jgi:translocation and assembly module TamB
MLVNLPKHPDLMRLPSFKDSLLVLLITIIGLLVLILVSVNLPYGRRFITTKINSILSKSDIPLHVTSVRIFLPVSVTLDGLTLSGQSGDTIVFAKHVQADFVPMALFKKRILITNIYLENATINISRNDLSGNINIAEAFLKENSDSIAKPENDNKSWDILISNADLSDINFLMSDQVSGIHIKQKIGKARLIADKMSLSKKVVHINYFEISETTGSVQIDPVKFENNSVDSTSWDIGLEKINLKNINQTYNNTGDKLLFELKLGEASAGINKTDLKNKLIDFNVISVSQTSTVLCSDIQPDSAKASVNATSVIFPWTIKGSSMVFDNISMKLGPYRDSEADSVRSGFSITDLNLDLSNLIFKKTEVGITVNKADFSLNNGFSLKKMKGSLESFSGKTTLKLSAETTNSLFDIEGSADVFISYLITNPSILQKAAARFTNCSISMKDLMYLNPDFKVNPVFITLAKQPFKLDGSIILGDSVINFSKISVSQDQGFILALNGKINNNFQPEKIRGELQYGVTNINTSWLKEIIKPSDVLKDLPDSAYISITGTLSDSLALPSLTLKLLSDYGNISLNGSFDYIHDSFLVKSHFEKFMLDKVLGNNTLGPISGSGEIAGTGIRRKVISASVIVVIDSLRFMQYNYTKTKIECKVSPENYNLKLLIEDPSLKCDLNAIINKIDSVIIIKTYGNLFAQLNNLHLYKDTLSVRGTLQADFQKNNDQIKTSLNISEVKFTTTYDNAVIKQINTTLITDQNRTGLTAKSDFFDIDVKIEKSIGGAGILIQGFKDYIKSFIDSIRGKPENRISFLPEMEARIEVRPNKAIDIIVQDTTLHFTEFVINLKNRISEGVLNYSLTGKDLKYHGLETASLKGSLADSAGVLNLQIEGANCVLFSWPIKKLLVTSRFERWQGLTRMEISDKSNTILYDFAISSRVDSNNIIFSIPSRQLILNGSVWKMDTPDLLAISRTSKMIQPSLKMHTDSSFFSITSEYKSGIKSFKGEIRTVALTSLLPANIIPGNPYGILSGTADFISNENKSREIKTDLIIKNIKWSDLYINNLILNGNYRSNKVEDYSLDINAVLDSSTISLSVINPESGKRTINAELTNLPIKTFQPFVKNYLSDLRGNISGNLIASATGNIENFNGELAVSNANVKINTINSSFKIPKDKVVFEANKIVLKNFIILDSLDNKLIADGSVSFGNIKSILTDLDISSSNLQVMHRKEDENGSFYGDIYVDSHLSIKGPIKNPELKGKIILTKGTEIFFRQTEDLSLSESEQVLTFVNKNAKVSSGTLTKPGSDGIYTKASIAAVIEIDPATNINISLSKKLYNIGIISQGGGVLNYNMLVNNQINLTGKYEINKGTADVKMTGWPNKSFNITKGGYLRWDGKLEDPEINFEAVNRVRSSYTNPVDNKPRDVDFNVTLRLAKRLSTLEVLFTINTPDQYLMSIINTLSPEEQMRQALTILLFAKIDLPGISTSSDYMTEQVNQLVASQLNQLTKTTFKGIDISFGIDSYVQTTQSGGQETKTSLSYELKRSLLNNRAQIEISGRLNDVNKQPGASDLSMNNFSFEYRLDSSATKFFKVYNEHTYEDVFEGEVIKTGIGITYRKSYPTLGDIWRKEKKIRKNKIPTK